MSRGFLRPLRGPWSHCVRGFGASERQQLCFAASSSSAPGAAGAGGPRRAGGSSRGSSTTPSPPSAAPSSISWDLFGSRAGSTSSAAPAPGPGAPVHPTAFPAPSVGSPPPDNLKGVHFDGRAAYLDVQATTPTDFRVLDAMMRFYVERYGNPHSRSHMYGWESDQAVETARQQVADLINADKREIVFTSGATESNNLALKGIADFYKGRGNHIITVQTEHKCVLDSCRFLQTQGFDVTYLPVDETGLVDLEALAAAVRPDTILVSAMLVNNEIGTVLPIREMAELVRKRNANVKFHCDAAQAVGKLPVDVHELGVDALSLSGHKLYGPKGVGALYVRRRPKLRLRPHMNGGGQERGLRSGTLPTPLCVGLGEACVVAQQCMDEDREHIAALAHRLRTGLESRLADVALNGHPTDRWIGNVNLSFAYVEGESLLMGMKDIAVSSGSACTSATLEPSYVLRALGVAEELAHTSIRFGIGRFTTAEEVDFAIEHTVKTVDRLRELSPLWEMAQQGIDIGSIQWTQH